MSIERLRGCIDELDRKLVELLNERARLALKIAEKKRVAGLPLNSPERESQVLENATASNHGPLPREAIQRIFRAVIAECRALEEVMAFDRGDEARGHPGPDSRGEREAG